MGKEKKDNGLEQLTRVCNEITRVSKQYSYLWDEEDIWEQDDKSLLLARGFIAQDEEFYIRLKKDGKRFVFGGKNFSYYDGKGLTGKDAIEKIREYGVRADELRKRFYTALKEPLGKYLAKKDLEKLGLGMKND